MQNDRKCIWKICVFQIVIQLPTLISLLLADLLLQAVQDVPSCFSKYNNTRTCSQDKQKVLKIKDIAL
jgi:hypothetical protein